MWLAHVCAVTSVLAIGNLMVFNHNCMIFSKQCFHQVINNEAIIVHVDKYKLY